MSTRSAGNVLRAAGRSLGLYLAWTFSVLAALYAMLKTWEAIKSICVTMRLGAYGYLVVSVFSLVILGVTGLVVTLCLLSYYQRGVAKGLLPRRFLHVTLIEAGVIAVALVALMWTG